MASPVGDHSAVSQNMRVGEERGANVTLRELMTRVPANAGNPAGAETVKGFTQAMRVVQEQEETRVQERAKILQSRSGGNPLSAINDSEISRSQGGSVRSWFRNAFSRIKSE